MENKEIQFKQFLKENKLVPSKLNEPIQEKIDIFYRLFELSDTIQQSDLQELEDQIDQLDIEILEDIEEQFEDQLSNNEPLEAILKTEGIAISKPKKSKKKSNSDESIIEELVKMGRTKNIGKSELESLGIKTKIERSTIIGDFLLKRVSFVFFRYDIKSLKKK